MTRIHSYHPVVLGLLLILMTTAACDRKATLPQQFAPSDTQADIFPDYKDIVIPSNIAPLNFMVKDSGAVAAVAQLQGANGKEILEQADDNMTIRFDTTEWKNLLSENKGKDIQVNVYVQTGENWLKHKPHTLTVAEESIDPFLSYRLIEPGYELYRQVGIYQRNVENYDEESIITNRQTDGGCMNCHSFCNYNPEQVMIHLRKNYPGTYVGSPGATLRKLVSPKSLVYPSWHPGGRFIAFSQNDTKQMFHTTDRNRIEVFDFSSDIVVYDLETDSLIRCPLLMSGTKFETFPSWSPDGKTLYFCSADSVDIPSDYDKVHYSLCSIGFDADRKQFGDTVTIIYDANLTQKSVSFPRCSPDARHLVFTLSDYGNFSIWHKEARLMMLPVDGILSAQPVSMLPDFRASYHSWSSNSCWMVMASRQDDGLYTRPYIVHIDEEGKLSKPFLLPQPDASHYKRIMKSYNLPEFVTGKVSRELMSDFK